MESVYQDFIVRVQFSKEFLYGEGGFQEILFFVTPRNFADFDLNLVKFRRFLFRYERGRMSIKTYLKIDFTLQT